MQYRRSHAKGATFFFTLVTYQRQKLFKDSDNIDLLRCSIRQVKNRYDFEINAFVILLDHLHFIWTLPEKDNQFSMRWRMIKSRFTKKCSEQYKRELTLTRRKKKEQCIWQRRFWEHQIRDENDFKRHVDYIHYNPVKHQYVSTASDWPYSSFHHYVKIGIYANDWGVDSMVDLGE